MKYNLLAAIILSASVVYHANVIRAKPVYINSDTLLDMVKVSCNGVPNNIECTRWVISKYLPGSQRLTEFTFGEDNQP